MIDVTLNSAGEVVLTDEVMLATEAPRRSGVRLPDGSTIYWSGWEWVVCAAGSGAAHKLGMPAPGTEGLHQLAQTMLKQLDAIRSDWAAQRARVAAEKKRESEVKAAREAAAHTVEKRARSCKHARTTEKIVGYTGGVATEGWRMNPSAAGGVCIVTTCTDCGSVQRTNSNGRHEEIGPWWLTDAKWLLEGSPHTSAVADALFARELEGELARRGLRDAR